VDKLPAYPYSRNFAQSIDAPRKYNHHRGTLSGEVTFPLFLELKIFDIVMGNTWLEFPGVSFIKRRDKAPYIDLRF
jgi:hypothetical protein